MALSAAEKETLLALRRGWTLKSHRYLDGRKEYRLHPLGRGEARTVAWETVDRLRERTLIESNKKFPAATYLLTERGKKVAERVAGQMGDALEDGGPLTSSGWE